MNPLPKSIGNGERFSFFQLFAEKDLAIEIPIIQRDYAQGRKGAQEIRVRFLQALYDYLEKNEPFRDLDFVYGSISKQEGKTMLFVPLDGQQRLTTLFLLHWYLAWISGQMALFQQQLIKEKGKGRGSRFTYETRSSAREFCDALMVNGHDLSALDGEPLSIAVRNSGWYFLSWRYDPTVQSMLTMVDAIESQFKGRPEFFDRLIDLDSPVITFQFLDLREFQLTDDLYIKMNSRGVPLTPFENFKAKLSQLTGDIFSDEELVFELSKAGTSKKVGVHDYFTWKIDTDWADFFWRNRDIEVNAFDERLMNFIRVILSNWYALNNASKEEDFITLMGTQATRRNFLSFFDYLEYGALTKDSMRVLIQSFDALLRAHDLHADFANSTTYNPNQVLSSAFRNDLSYPNRIKFHAFIGYVIRHEDVSGISEWMRIVHNLVHNSFIDHTDELLRGLTEIEILLPQADQILQIFAAGNSGIGAFYQRQVQEEEIKAHLILKGDKWSALIRQAERHGFFDGQIGFLLEFSGILDYVERNRNCGWSDQDDHKFVSTFSDYKCKAEAAFAFVMNSNQELHWERAVLTKGDYLLTASYSRKNFLNSVVKTRDYSWKRLLRLSGVSDKDGQELTQRRLLVKAVFDDTRFNPLDVGGSCQAIIRDVPQDWRSYFVLNYELIKVCGQGFIRFNNAEDIRLLPKSKMTYHYELRSYNFFLEKVRGRNFPPFVANGYFMNYGDSGSSHAQFQGWSFRDVKYELAVFFREKFYIFLYKVINRGFESASDEDVIAMLLDLNFTSGSSSGIHMWAAIDDDQVIEQVNLLCQGLKELEMRRL